MKTIFILITILSSFNLFASSCCGGGSSSSMIITGDNQSEYSFSFSQRTDIGATDSKGYSTVNNQNVLDQQSVYNLQFQNLIADRLQVAVKTSFVQKQIRKQNRFENESGFGDIELQGSFEFLPEYTFSAYKPRGFVYLKGSIPTSHSLYNSNSAVFSDVRGSGLYSLSAGSFFIKHISNWTLKSGAELQHLFGKNFNNVNLDSYQKFYLPIGVAYSNQNWPITLGVNSTFNYQTSKTLSGAVNSTSGKEYFWELGTFVNWTISREETLGLSLSDSSLVGKNINSSLYRTIGLSYTIADPI
jgi:hypothetical protein